MAKQGQGTASIVIVGWPDAKDDVLDNVPNTRNASRRPVRWAASALFAGKLMVIAAAFLPAAAATAQERQISIGGGAVSHVVVRPSTTLTITTDRPFSNLVLGDVKIADVVPLSDRSFYIQGKTTGITSVSIYGDGDSLLGVVQARVSIDFSDVRAAISAALPGADVKVSNFNDRLHLSGIVKSGPDLVRAVDIAQQFSPLPVINAIAVTDAQQVALEVRIIEAKRTIGRDLGVNFRVTGGTSIGVTGSRLRINADPETGQPTSYLDNDAERNSQGTPFGSLVAQVLEGAGVRVDMIINALEKKGLARRLAQPNLTTVSGEKASFHAGGEVPIQVAVTAANGSSATQTEYRPYGVRLEFVPTVLDGGLINLRVMTEVSEIDAAISVNGNPGFTSRKAQTVIELRDGQSFAMAGLLQTVNAKTVEQLPWLGQVPILGALFRSNSFQKQETDLVVVVTPRIVQPAPPGTEPRTPLDNTRSADDVEFFALGLLEVDKDMLSAFKEGKDVSGPYGHMIELEEEAGDALSAN